MIKRSSINVFRSSIFALFLKEMYDSVGIKKSGYFWLFFDVIFVVLIFAGLKGYLRDLGIPGLDTVVFLAVNVMAFFFFRTTLQLMTNSFNANKSLFDYRQVKPFDVACSVFLFNLYVRILATMVLLFVGWYLNFDLTIKDFAMVFGAILWLALFSFGLGLLSAVLASFFELWKKLVGYMMLPLLLTSAVFYTVESLPQDLQELIFYNPVAHFMEMLHGSYFMVLDTRFVDYTYMTYWTVFPLFIALVLYIKTEKGIIAS